MKSGAITVILGEASSVPVFLKSTMSELEYFDENNELDSCIGNWPTHRGCWPWGGFGLKRSEGESGGIPGTLARQRLSGFGQGAREAPTR